jgi:hypothetical protein
MHSEQLCASARPFGGKFFIWCRKLDFGKKPIFILEKRCSTGKTGIAHAHDTRRKGPVLYVPTDH